MKVFKTTGRYSAIFTSLSLFGGLAVNAQEERKPIPEIEPDANPTAIVEEVEKEVVEKTPALEEEKP